MEEEVIEVKFDKPLSIENRLYRRYTDQGVERHKGVVLYKLRQMGYTQTTAREVLNHVTKLFAQEGKL